MRAGSLKNSHHRRSQGSSSFPEKLSTDVSRWIRGQWEFLPHDMPPPGAVKYCFYLWRDEGTDQDIHDLLRWQSRRSGSD